MKKRNYTHVQLQLPEIEAMIAAGKTQREVAEHFGFKDKSVVKTLLKRQREKRRKLEAGIVPRPKGRPRKAAQLRDIAAEQAYETVSYTHLDVYKRQANPKSIGGKLPGEDFYYAK